MSLATIHGWKDASEELVRALAVSVGITAYEMRQRLIGDGPSVVAVFADQQQARAVAMKLNLAGVATLIADTNTLRSTSGRFVVRRFELRERCLRIEDHDGHCAEIAYGTIDLLLPGTRILEQSETITVILARSLRGGRMTG